MSYVCEKCGKTVEDFEKFGSGRFCSRSCANGHKHSEKTKQNISKGMLKETICECQFCGKQFTTLTAKASHERLCNLNPNKLNNPQHFSYKQSEEFKLKKAQQKFKLQDMIELDITNAEMEDYLNTHKKCEICGKTIEEAVKWKSKNAPKRLCIDHDHKTLKFRGVLCSVCNRQLGWYEANKEAIESYLNKK